MTRRAGKTVSLGARIFLTVVALAAIGAVGFGVYAVSNAPPASQRGSSSLPPQRAEQAGAAPASAPATPPQ